MSYSKADQWIDIIKRELEKIVPPPFVPTATPKEDFVRDVLRKGWREIGVSDDKPARPEQRKVYP